MCILVEIDRRNKRRWNRQILRHRDKSTIEARKGLVAMYIHDHSRLPHPYVEIDHLLISVLYEDEFHPVKDSQPERNPLRFCGYRVAKMPDGAQWGGTSNIVFFKDLTLSPNYSGRGQRLRLDKSFHVELALELDGCLSSAARHPELHRPNLQLPHLWAGFRRRSADNLRGVGLELELASRRTGISTLELLRQCERDFEGLKLYPLDLVTIDIESATTVFADIAEFRRPRVFRIPKFPRDLVGQLGASNYDFYHGRYRLPAISHPQEFCRLETGARHCTDRITGNPFSNLMLHVVK
jgi:hypothetical protein